MNKFFYIVLYTIVFTFSLICINVFLYNILNANIAYYLGNYFPLFFISIVIIYVFISLAMKQKVNWKLILSILLISILTVFVFMNHIKDLVYVKY